MIYLQYQYNMLEFFKVLFMSTWVHVMQHSGSCNVFSQTDNPFPLPFQNIHVIGSVDLIEHSFDNQNLTHVHESHFLWFGLLIVIQNGSSSSTPSWPSLNFYIHIITCTYDRTTIEIGIYRDRETTYRFA